MSFIKWEKKSRYKTIARPQLHFNFVLHSWTFFFCFSFPLQFAFLWQFEIWRFLNGSGFPSGFRRRASLFKSRLRSRKIFGIHYFKSFLHNSIARPNYLFSFWLRGSEGVKAITVSVSSAFGKMEKKTN